MHLTPRQDLPRRRPHPGRRLHPCRTTTTTTTTDRTSGTRTLLTPAPNGDQVGYVTTAYDGELTSDATPDGDDLGSLTRDIQATLDATSLPTGASATIGGVSADQQEAFGQLGIALGIAIAIVYVVMNVLAEMVTYLPMGGITVP